MISYSLKKIADVLGGKVYGDENACINGVCIDSREIKPHELFIPIIGERVNGHRFVADLPDNCSLWQKGEPNRPDNINIVEVDDVVTALQKLAAHYRREFKGKVIGVTGSSGKTSTKDIISSVLSTRFKVHKTSGNQNNEIGVPRTILSINEDDDIAVVEMGISGIGEMEQLVDIVLPDITIITSISLAHIMNFKNMETTAHEKCLINSQLGNGQCFYCYDAYNVDYEVQSQHLVNKPISYGLNANSDYQVVDCQVYDGKTHFRVSRHPEEDLVIPVLGKHQALNAAGALAIGEYFGLTLDEIKKGLSQVALTKHRLQLRKAGVSTIIDDTYNCNPGSLVAGINVLNDIETDLPKIACLGDMLELGENSPAIHADIFNKADFSKFEETVLHGEMMYHLYKKLASEGFKCRYYADYDELYQYLYERVQDPCLIFFKASNGMKFTAIADKLEEAYE